MQKLLSVFFCIASLAAVGGLSWLAFPYAARSSQEVQQSSATQGAELFDDVELGDFGSIPVLDMMQYYIDNPPLEPSGGGKTIRFQGC